MEKIKIKIKKGDFLLLPKEERQDREMGWKERKEKKEMRGDGGKKQRTRKKRNGKNRNDKNKIK